MLSLDFIAIPLLVVAALVFIAVLAGILSARIGFPFLLIFLLAGGIAGEDGLGIEFTNFNLSFWVGNIALAVILIDGGLRTNFDTFRTGLKPSLLLATLGVLVSTVLTAAAAVWLLDLTWPMGLLLGAIVGSTDAAAVFSVLKGSGIRINERVASTLEIESGMNDPMAVYLTLTFIGVATAMNGGDSAHLSWQQILIDLTQQFGIGGILGIAGGFAIAWLMPRMRIFLDGESGILALLLISAGIGVFALTTWLGGSGFLAVYVYGVIVGNRARRSVRQALSAMDGFAWLAQAGMFLLLGLLVTPSQALPTMLPALGVALFLMLVARPLAVWLCLAPFRFRTNEITFIAWVGLRGAVPIVLAIFPVMANIEGASIFLNVAFVVVIISLLFQGGTLPWFARRLGLALPDKDDSKKFRQVFGDFVLDANVSIAMLGSFYNLPVPEENPEMTLAEWINKELRRPPILGDRIDLGNAKLVVRKLEDGKIRQVGLKLPS
ncbi:MAG: potassium/proton antiporter [Porticoccaceae bacterium]|nr:potassium/proton antiporter [Porticoccaceae bacterium]